MEFRGKYYFLSNMYPCIVHKYKCVESVYQAYKCPERAKEFQPLDGYAAKKLGKEVTLRKDWNSVKYRIMYQLLELKFQNYHLAKMLARTGDIDLVEDNTWGDTYWGVCRGKGENNLGRILMGIRDMLDIPDVKTVCFTGSRPKYLEGYKFENYDYILDAIKSKLESLYDEGFREFITGGAQGIDQLVLYVLISMKTYKPDIIITVYLPYPSYGDQFNFGDLFSKRFLYNMLQKADYVSFIANVTNQSETVPALFTRNVAMIDSSDRLVAFYKTLTNGTKHAINEAKECGIEVEEIVL